MMQSTNKWAWIQQIFGLLVGPELRRESRLVETLGPKRTLAWLNSGLLKITASAGSRRYHGA